MLDYLLQLSLYKIVFRLVLFSFTVYYFIHEASEMEKGLTDLELAHLEGNK